MTSSMLMNVLAATHQGFFYPVQASKVAADVDPLAWFIHGVTIFFTVAIIGITAYFTIKYRATVHPVPQPPGHNNVLEVAWTALPAVIVFICFFWGFRVYMKMSTPLQGSVEQIVATGQTWSWLFAYQNPTGGAVATSDELFLPRGRPVMIKLQSLDVIHSLYIPAMRMKKDVVPGRYNEMYLEPTRVGTYDVYCAEYCGDSHSRMFTKVHVLEPDEYVKKIIEISNPVKPGLSPQEIGTAIVKMNGCNSCHSIDGAAGTGPTWKDLAGATGHQLASGQSITVDDNYILESIRNPNAKVVKGFGPPSAMNPYSDKQISDEYVRYIIAYMKSISVHAPKDESTATSKPQAATQNATVPPGDQTPPANDPH